MMSDLVTPLSDTSITASRMIWRESLPAYFMAIIGWFSFLLKILWAVLSVLAIGDSPRKCVGDNGCTLVTYAEYGVIKS